MSKNIKKIIKKLKPDNQEKIEEIKSTFTEWHNEIKYYNEIENGNFPDYETFVKAQKNHINTFKEYSIELEKRLNIKTIFFEIIYSKVQELLEELLINQEVPVLKLKKKILEELNVYENVTSGTYTKINEGLIELFEKSLNHVINNYLTKNNQFILLKLSDSVRRIEFVEKNVKKFNNMKVIQVSNTTICSNCFNQINKSSKFCPECSFKFKKCLICLKILNKNDSIGICPFCETDFHLSHVREYIKLKGSCPSCSKGLKDHQIQNHY